jgi:hypothetical protein
MGVFIMYFHHIVEVCDFVFILQGRTAKSLPRQTLRRDFEFRLLRNTGTVEPLGTLEID